MGNLCGACQDIEEDIVSDISKNVEKRRKPKMIKHEAEFVAMHEIEPEIAERTFEMNNLSEKAEVVQKRIEEFNFSYARDSYVDLSNNPSKLSKEDFVGPYRYVKDESTYEGHVNEGVREGLGVSVTKDGDVYEGAWMKDKPEGYGRYIQFNGDFYEGIFHHGYPHGKGKMVHFESEITYEGDFEKGMKHGTGVEMCPDGTVYAGEFKK